MSGVSRLLSFFVALLLVACGSKTGLLVPEVDEDASVDADLPDMPFDMPDDMPQDMPPDLSLLDACMDVPFPLTPRPAEVMFTIDRSTSMNLGLDGLTPPTPASSRWVVLGDVLDGSLRAEPLIEPGAKFFPDFFDPGPTLEAEEACRVPEVVEVPVGPTAVNAIARVFRDTGPFGGTPTVDALIVAADALRASTREDVPQFIVLATDGGPNCNPPPGPLGSCRCAGTPASCLDPTFGRINCLDDERALRVISDIAEDIPVFVVGFDDPTRPDLADVLDEMAVAGGRPRPEGASRRFYDVRERADLEAAFDEITASVGRCLLVTDFVPDDTRLVQVLVNGLPVPEDATDGWQWRDREAGELELFGDACRLATANPDVEVQGLQTCFSTAP